MSTKSLPVVPNNRMVMIDCCRGIAALFIVFVHADRSIAKEALFGVDPLHGWFNFGGRAVDFFFVLSGFIIAYVHWFDVGRQTCIWSYLIKRWIRVYPILWVVSILSIMARLVGSSPGSMPAGWTEKAELILGSLTLLPTSQIPIPGVAWTLRHEAFFYLVFGLVIWRPRIGSWVLALWGCLCVYHAMGGIESNFLTDFFLSAYNLEFLLGVCCGGIMRVTSVRAPVILACIGVACFLTAGAFYEMIPDHKPWIVNGTSGWQVAEFGLSSALIILGLAQIDIHRPVVAPKWLVLIGAASYSIYLVHASVMFTFGKAMKTASIYVNVTPLQAFLAISSMGVMAGICCHLWIELPLLQVVRQAVLPGRRVKRSPDLQHLVN